MADDDLNDLEPSEDKPAFNQVEGEKVAEFDKEIKVVESQKEEGVIKETKEKEEEPPYQQFATKEELDTFIDQEAKRRIDTAKEIVKPETATDKPKLELYKGYFDQATNKWVGEAPKDWNDFANRLLESITPQVVTELQSMTTKQQQELDVINQEFDREYNELARQKLVPTLTSTEGKEINKQITTIGATYGQSSMTKAYELWSKISKDQGGGLDYTAPVQSKMQAQKQRAGMVASSQGTTSKPAGMERTYEQLRKKQIDDLIEERIKQLP